MTLRRILTGFPTGLLGLVAVASGCGSSNTSSNNQQRVTIVRPEERPAQTSGLPPDKEAEVQLVLQQREISTRKCYQDVLNERKDRAFQGTVKVEQLKGPVGIAHLGTIIAARGYIWLLFFLGLVSVNLAVINFLPVPIADGGHFVFLVYEQFAGRPPSVRFQNAAAITGLVLIVGLFLVVTFNDISNLFG